MPKSDSAETCVAGFPWPVWLAAGEFVRTRGIEDSQNDTATSAVAAKTNLGEGTQFQKLRRAGSAEMRARKDASNDGEGEIAGTSSSVLHSERNSSARERQEAQLARCSSTAWRSAGRARPSMYATNLLSSAAHCL
jgi:hypothetical protein